MTLSEEGLALVSDCCASSSGCCAAANSGGPLVVAAREPAAGAATPCSTHAMPTVRLATTGTPVHVDCCAAGPGQHTDCCTATACDSAKCCGSKPAADAAHYCTAAEAAGASPCCHDKGTEAAVHNAVHKAAPCCSSGDCCAPAGGGTGTCCSGAEAGKVAATSCCASQHAPSGCSSHSCSTSHHHHHDHDCRDHHHHQQQQHKLAPAPSRLLRLGELVTTRAHAAGLCCPMEANLCHSVLGGLSGVASVQVSVISKLVTVTHDPASLSPAAVVAALNGVGLRAQLMAGARHGDGAVAAADAAGAAGGGGAAGAAGSWVPPWQAMVCGALVVISAAGALAPPGIRMWLEVAGLAAAAIGAPPIATKAFNSLRGRILDINALMLVACVGAIALGDWTEAGALVSLFALAEWLESKCMGRAAGALAEVLRMQPETALLLDPPANSSCGGCGGCGSAACATAVASPRKSTLGGSPRKGGSPSRKGGRSTGGGGASSGPGFSRVPAASLSPGDLVLVRPGDRFPIDGVVTAGASTADESMLTGESRAVAKAPGARALAGTVNNGTGPLTVRVEAAPGDSAVARLGALIEQAGQSKSKRDVAIERFARWFTPAVVGIAVAAVLLGLVLDASRWRDWLYLSLVVLVTACPCALVISTPVASVAGMTRAAQKGVLIKGGRYLELLGRLKAVSLDKTGTLTQGAFEIKAVRTYGGHSEAAVLSAAAALEQQSTHPVAAAVVGYAAARGVAGAALAVHGVRDVAGRGVTGTVDGSEVSVLGWVAAYEAVISGAATRASGGGGSPTRATATANAGSASPLASSSPRRAAAANAAACSNGSSGRPPRVSLSDPALAADLSDAQALVDEWAAKGASAVGVVMDGRLAAVLLVADGLRSDAAAAVNDLRALGLRLSILTGDGMGAAVAAAEQLGMDVSDVYAELLPRDKLEMLSVLRRREGALAHVGDGVNDAPALAAADVGVAMGAAGAAAAVEAADVALFGSDLGALAFAIRLGRAAGRVVNINIAAAITVKLAVLIAAATGATSLWLSLVADVGASLGVTLHALSLLRFESSGDTGGGFSGFLRRLRAALPWSGAQRYSSLGGWGDDEAGDRGSNNNGYAASACDVEEGLAAPCRHRKGLATAAVEMHVAPAVSCSKGNGCCGAQAAGAPPCQHGQQHGPPLFVIED